uniref:MADF domain-containing protein n=2 Tax=Heliothis virescens TaxID=7102 RepID=A0A2A4JNE2_HELVI
MPSLSLKIVQDGGAVTRKVKFDSRMTVQDAHKLVKEKVIVPDKGKEYGLFLRSADSSLSGVWLDEDRTLENYMLRDGDSLDYICRIRNLRVRLLDDTVKTLQVDEAKTVAELMMEICARIGIKNYDEYGLCHEEVEEAEEPKESKEKGTLKRQQPKDRDVVLEQLSKKLNTDDNVAWLDHHRTLREQGVDSKDTLLLKRRLFYSDRNVDSRDPVQLNLLYVQTRDAILVGRHPVTEQQVCERDAPTTIDWRRTDASSRRSLPTVARVNKMFHEKLDIKLIGLVKGQPILYDTNHPKYMDFNTREVAWQKIGDELKMSGSDCKTRWVNIRDVHRRIMKKNLSDPVHPPRRYKYDNEMTFMNTFYKDVVVLSMQEDDDEDEDQLEDWQNTLNETSVVEAEDDEDLEPPVPKKKPKKPRKPRSKKKKEPVFEEVNQTMPSFSEVQPSELDPADPVDAFLLSIGSTLKTFSPYHLNLAKSKIFAVVQDHDMQQILEKRQENSDKVTTSDTLFHE